MPGPRGARRGRSRPHNADKHHNKPRRRRRRRRRREKNKNPLTRQPWKCHGLDGKRRTRKKRVNTSDNKEDVLWGRLLRRDVRQICTVARLEWKKVTERSERERERGEEGEEETAAGDSVEGCVSRRRAPRWVALRRRQVEKKTNQVVFP